MNLDIVDIMDMKSTSCCQNPSVALRFPDNPGPNRQRTRKMKNEKWCDEKINLPPMLTIFPSIFLVDSLVLKPGRLPLTRQIPLSQYG